MRFNPNPEWQRVVLIGILIFAEALLVNFYAILSQGRWPTTIESAGFTVAGLIQLVTYYLGFLHKEEKTE